MVQAISDLVILLGWAWQNLTDLFVSIFLPVRFIYTFLKSFFSSAFAPVTPTSELWTWPTEILSVFQSIPYFNYLNGALIIGVIIIMVVFLMKQFLKS